MPAAIMTAHTCRQAVTRDHGHSSVSRISFLCRLWASLRLCTISRVNQRLWDWHSPVDALTALLEGFEDNGLVVDIDTAADEGESLRDPAADVVEHTAQGPYGPVGFRGGPQEGVPLEG